MPSGVMDALGRVAFLPAACVFPSSSPLSRRSSDAQPSPATRGRQVSCTARVSPSVSFWTLGEGLWAAAPVKAPVAPRTASVAPLTAPVAPLTAVPAAVAAVVAAAVAVLVAPRAAAVAVLVAPVSVCPALSTALPTSFTAVPAAPVVVFSVSSTAFVTGSVSPPVALSATSVTPSVSWPTPSTREQTPPVMPETRPPPPVQSNACAGDAARGSPPPRVIARAPAEIAEALPTIPMCPLPQCSGPSPDIPATLRPSAGLCSRKLQFGIDV
ncbi:hypothetical protein GCM10027612_57550 [Microbispora bryophytorum subsp. camponoti]